VPDARAVGYASGERETPESAFWSGGGCRGESPAKLASIGSSGADFRVTMAEAARGASNLISFPVAAPKHQRENNRCQAIFRPTLDEK